MQTQLSQTFKETAQGKAADAILRSCVHCGMCNATCPTYQLLGDERDSPRGRIYLIKQVLEGHTPTQKTQSHLDRCLNCGACESTCPSGVAYSALLDIGRELMQKAQARPLHMRLFRSALVKILTHQRSFASVLTWASKARNFMPKRWREKLPMIRPAGDWPAQTHARRVILLEGCVQAVMGANINAACARVLDAIEVQSIYAPQSACCGSLHAHLDQREAALDLARQNIDAWWPLLQPDASQVLAGAEYIVMTTSGCGVQVKDYGRLLADDQDYAAKAEEISARCLDLAEYLPRFKTGLQNLLKRESSTVASTVPSADSHIRLAWHAPCTLQHGQKIKGNVEQLLSGLGIDLQTCADAQSCCGSAGTYSLFQSEIADQLRDQKLAALDACNADVIVSANLACQAHLQSGTHLPVRHWIEILDQVLTQKRA